MFLRQNEHTLAFLDAWSAVMDKDNSLIDSHAFNEVVKQGWTPLPAKIVSDSSAHNHRRLLAISSNTAEQSSSSNSSSSSSSQRSQTGGTSSNSNNSSSSSSSRQVLGLKSGGRVLQSEEAATAPTTSSSSSKSSSTTFAAAKSPPAVPQLQPHTLPSLQRRQLGATAATVEASSASSSRLLLGWDGKLTVGVLPVTVFPNGHTFFVQRLHELAGVAPYIIRTTHQFGGVLGKRHRLREVGLFEDGEGYYTGAK